MLKNKGLNLVMICCLSLLSVGCNRKLEHTHQVSIDHTFDDILKDFVQESIAQGRPLDIDDLSIHFTSGLPAQTLGECFMYNHGQDGTPTILINAQDWQYESATTKKVMLYHELGHCVLFREHNETYLISGYVTSIMFPYIQPDYVYLNNWSYYMWELFHGT